MTTERKLISIVTPTYNEEANIRPCVEAVRRVFQTELSAYDYEHIFCDNASQDNTVGVLREIAGSDRRVKVIVNSRNFGFLRSTFNGIINTSGHAVLCFLPADLQDPPEVLPQMVKQWENGYQVVHGVRKTRQENIILRSLRRVYYRIVARLAEIEIPENVGEFQLVDRCVIQALRKFDDYYPYVRGMIASCGFKSIRVEYTWVARAHGRSKHRLYHLIDLALNGIISFTNVPLRLCMFFGFMIAALSLLYSLWFFLVSLIYFHQLAPRGIPTLIVVVFFFSGLQLFFFGVLGEYIGAIHFQVRKRPMVIESERINFDHP